ncbi:MAG: hypothetical protein JXN61_08270 [Sedimentisphaerales bacterium]|nr:hypothetical protein [Sedimentisphaerales bacterium]
MMRLQAAALALVCLAWIGAGPAPAADVILNEYNAVNGSDFLNGGTAFQDEDGGYASDSYFGRVQGNGGDWFELVVITDHLDMRRWKLEIWMEGMHNETLDLTAHPLWSDLRSGTIITVAEDVPDNVSFDPNAGDWWINVQADTHAAGTYISNNGFPVTNDDWQLIIRDANDSIRYGPAGEGVSPPGGINSREIFRLQANPAHWITPLSAYYNDGSSLSTFGSPNQWGTTEFGFRYKQNFRPLRGYDLADLDENGIVDMLDFCILADSWSATGDSHNWNPDCDISTPPDDSINGLDLARFSSNWLNDSSQ